MNPLPMDNKERLKERLYEELKFLDISKRNRRSRRTRMGRRTKAKKTSDKKAKKF